jgi:dystonin
VESFDEWYVQVLDILETREVDNESDVDEVAKQKDQKRPEFESLIKNGKNLVGRKNVTDVNPCKDTIAELVSMPQYFFSSSLTPNKLLFLSPTRLVMF